MSVGADNFADAPAVTIATNGATYTSTATPNNTYSVQSGEPTPTIAGSLWKTAWWTYTPTSSGTATLTTASSVKDAEMAVYTGSALNSLTKVASDSDSGAGVAPQITMSVTAGTTYRIQLGAYNNEAMDYQLVVTGPASGIASVSGSLTPTLPALVVDLSASYVPPLVTGTFGATLPASTASMSGAATTSSVAGTLTSSLPELFMVGAGTSDGAPTPAIGYGWSWRIEMTADIDPPLDPSTVLVPRPIVAVSTPVPTLVDGRPV